ncbi:MAG: radical SAM/SPASM domain-containing protein [Elusimicrobiota bacterium]
MALSPYFSARQHLSLARSLITKTSPAYVQFYITARCNLACEQCNIIYAHADAQEMNIGQIRAMAKNLAEIGVCIVLLIGGEPFVRKDIDLIVSAFSDAGIHVRLQTNGLATKEMMERCIAAGAHDISISLDSLNPDTQDVINGEFKNSWDRAIATISTVNAVFPKNGTAFFGTVLMPRNLFHIRDVVEFATAIGWGVSLVPAHITTPQEARGFRTFDDAGVCRFDPGAYPAIRSVLDEVAGMRRAGHNLYDSDEYLDDIYRFITGVPVRWRRRNDDVCDSPNLYFAVEPNGNVSPCCDFKLTQRYPAYHPDFPKWYRAGDIHRDVYAFTRPCAGCMYGSYPEITVTARFLKPLFKRMLYFNHGRPRLEALTSDRMKELAREIALRNKPRREEQERALAAHRS